MANAAWLPLAVVATVSTCNKGSSRPRTPRAQRTPTISTTTGLLALGIRDRPGADKDPRDPAALLTTNPYPYDQDPGEAGRPAGSPRPRPPEPTLPQIPGSTTDRSRPSGASGLTVARVRSGTTTELDGHLATVRHLEPLIARGTGSVGSELAPLASVANKVWFSNQEVRSRCNRLPRTDGGTIAGDG
jgi:hypothetical protein